jgi:hypothetical protein
MENGRTASVMLKRPNIFILRLIIDCDYLSPVIKTPLVQAVARESDSIKRLIISDN